MSDLNLRNGDGIAGMHALDRGSAALVFCDLPIGKTRAEFDRLPDLDQWFDAAWHCLRPTGAIVVMVADLGLAGRISLREHYRYDLVWEKSVATGFFLARKRPLRAHEHLLVFFRKQGVYNPQMVEVGRPINAAQRPAGVGAGANYGAHTKAGSSRAGATNRYPRSVLHAPSVGTSSVARVHPQQKPPQLCEWVVRTFTDPGDLVVDPCAGSGSALRAADTCGRRSIGWEDNIDNWRAAHALVEVG